MRHVHIKRMHGREGVIENDESKLSGKESFT